MSNFILQGGQDLNILDDFYNRFDGGKGDDIRSNTAILQETGRRPKHPIQMIARAYGLKEG